MAGLVRRHGWKLFGNLATTRDQALLVSAVGVLSAGGIENSALIRQKGAKPVDYQRIVSAHWTSAACAL
jgi:hypothetical protein